MNTYKRHRFPSDIICYAVWLYYRFNLSHCDIEDLLAERWDKRYLRDNSKQVPKYHNALYRGE